jgi:repressor of nif and glnA expression
MLKTQNCCFKYRKKNVYKNRTLFNKTKKNMSIENTIAAIDIWSSKIRTIIWTFNFDEWNHLHILWVW